VLEGCNGAILEDYLNNCIGGKDMWVGRMPLREVSRTELPRRLDRKRQSRVWHHHSSDWITQDQDRLGVTLHHLDPLRGAYSSKVSLRAFSVKCQPYAIVREILSVHGYVAGKRPQQRDQSHLVLAYFQTPYGALSACGSRNVMSRVARYRPS
jgi:hypothetical protein